MKDRHEIAEIVVITLIVAWLLSYFIHVIWTVVGPYLVLFFGYGKGLE